MDKKHIKDKIFEKCNETITTLKDFGFNEEEAYKSVLYETISSLVDYYEINIEK